MKSKSYGVVQFSQDADLRILADAENLARLALILRAPALGRAAPSESASKLDAFQTLRAIWLRLCRAASSASLRFIWLILPGRAFAPFRTAQVEGCMAPLIEQYA